MIDGLFDLAVAAFALAGLLIVGGGIGLLVFVVLPALGALIGGDDD